jgi:hypothetical protein
MKPMDQLIERYEEFQKLIKHPEYVLSDDEYDEYAFICQELLWNIMENNKDVLIRLRDR